MAVLTLNGALSEALEDFVDTFLGGIARVNVIGVTSSSGATLVSSMTGDGLLLASSGDVFLNGTIDGLKPVEGL